MPPALLAFACFVAALSMLTAFRHPDRSWKWDAAAAVAWITLGVSNVMIDGSYWSLENGYWAVANGWLAGLMTHSGWVSWHAERLHREGQA